MRTLSALIVAGLCVVGAAGCNAPKPPVGRWEGAYESPRTMIAARLEIDEDGAVYVSAPDALNISADSDADRAAIRERLAAGLASAWGEVAARKFDFDGTVFRKPGGVAPQMEWDPGTKQMTLIVYPGTQPSVRLPLRQVGQFSDDPWQE